MSEFGVRSIVEELRRRLIDIGRSNDLINFEPKPAAKKRIRLIDSSIEMVHSCLSSGTMEISAEKTLSTNLGTVQITVPMLPGIVSANNPKPGDKGFRRTKRPIVSTLPVNDPRYDLVDTSEGRKALQSDLPQAELDARLLTIKREHETSLQETGVGLACMVLGILEWIEDPRSKIVNHSPLLVMPITIDRQVVKNRHVHTIGSDEGEVHSNAALREALRTDHGIELPDINEGETPDQYLVRIETLVSENPGFTVRRHATVALMKSMQMVVWRDLDLAKWDDEVSRNHRLLPTLLGVEATSDRTGQFETDHDVATMMDVSYASVPPIIYDADTSQHSAIIDMVNGDDVAIEGPPGSGKSQTIANMIAAAVNQGKTVLFVAEKKTALDVVAGKLRERGFGDLLFELYSATASKVEVAKSLRKRIHATSSPNDPSLAKARSRLRARTVELRSHLHATTSLLAGGRDLYDEIWTSVALGSVLPDTLVRVSRTMPEHDCTADGCDIEPILRERMEAQYESASLKGQKDPWSIFPLSSSLDIRLVEALSADAAEAFARLARPIHSDVDETWSPSQMQIEALIGISSELVSMTAKSDLLRLAIQDGQRLRDPLNASRNLEIAAGKARGIDPRLTNMNPSLVIDIVRSALDLGVKSRGDAFRELTSAQHEDERWSTIILGIDTLSRHAPMSHEHAGRAARIAKVITGLLNMERTVSDVGTVAEGSDWKSKIEKLAHQHSILEREAAALIRNFDEEQIDEVVMADLEADLEIVRGAGMLGKMGAKYKNARARLASLLAKHESDDEVLTRRIRQFIEFSARWTAFMHDPSARALMPRALWKDDEPQFEEALAMADSYVKHAHAARDVGMNAKAILALDDQEKESLRSAAADIASSCSALNENDSPSEMAGKARLRLETLRDLISRCETLGMSSSSRLDQDMVDAAVELDAATVEMAASRDAAPASQTEMSAAVRDADMLDRNSVPEPIVEALLSSPAPADQARSIITSLSIRREEIQRAVEPLQKIAVHAGVTVSDLCDTDHRHVTDWKSLSVRLAGFDGASGTYIGRLRLKQAQDEISRIGLDGPVAHMLESSVPADKAGSVYMHARSRIAAHHGMIGQEGFAKRPRPHSKTLDEARADIRELDANIQKLDASQIVARCMSDTMRIEGVGKGPVGDWTQQALVDREVEKLKRHVPIRSLVARAAADLRQLKPIWLMSPSTVAQFLPRDPGMFEVLVIDEASQMLPEYALGAIMRTRQAVVVGDRHQMPPNTGFTKSADGADQAAAEAIEDVESILDMANRSFLRRRRLKWHYRSQHPSLIAFSNKQFYDDDLVVSPSASPRAIDLGVHCHKVTEPSYRTGENIGEAEELVASLASLVRSHPQHSYMIVAMNAVQTEIISEMIEQLEIDDPEYRAHKAMHEGETKKTIVVSLENCQGHERDIVLVSVVYGQRSASDKHVSQSFAGINGASGHRRLNVMITRAKRAVHLFTSMDASQISTQSTHRGVQDLREYIQYASDGVTVHDAQGREDPDSDFERVVGDALRDAGFGVTFQVGVRGFRIDIGVSSSPGQTGFIAGIECDGAHWHRGLSVRERDRIRQGVLEGLGWSIYRIWSTDWYHDPKAETTRLVDWLKGLQMDDTLNEHAMIIGDAQ